MAKASGDDAIFTFSGDELKKFFLSLNSNMDKIGKGMNGMTNKIAEGVKKGLGFFAKMGVAFVGLKKLIGMVPEIGQAFNIAKDIAIRNFLWPLRKMLMPLLQGMLNWVRDHRAAFVRWGQVVANIFKGIIGVAQSLFKAVKSVLDGIMKGISKVIGGAGGTIEKIINLLQFKLNSIMLFLGAILEEVGKFIGGFFEGILPHIQPVLDAVGNLLNLFNDLWKAIFGKDWDWNAFGKGLGEIVGGAIELATMGIQKLSEALTNLKDLIDLISGKEHPAIWQAKQLKGMHASLKGPLGMDGSAFTQALNPGAYADMLRLEKMSIEDIAKEIEEGKYRSKGINPSGIPLPTKNVKDAIITPQGVVHTDPDDYLIATKTPGAHRGDVYVTIGPITVQVTEGNAESAGRSFAAGIASRFKQVILGDMVKEGL